jgi:putative ABC transport system permease protein
MSALAVAGMAMATFALVRWRGQLAAGATRAVTADRLTARLQRALVVGEVALAVVLLAGSVLVVRSLSVFERTPLGFAPDRLTNTRLELRGARYVENAAVSAFGRTLLEQVRTLPGVEQAFLWGPGRPGHVTWVSFVLPERAANEPDPDRVMVTRHNISAGALAAAGIPVLRGREFLATDTSSDLNVAVVSQSMAEKFWPGQDPIGQRFTFITPVTPRPWFQVVGVAADAAHRRRTYSLTLPAYDYYQFFDQRPERTVTLVTRSNGDEAAVMPAIRAAVQRADPSLPVRDMRTMSELLGEEEQTFRFASGLLSGFAALTFLFAAAGLYAMVSYIMTLRGRELALRSALGATRARLFSSLVAGGLRLGLAGIIVGLIAARLSAKYLDALLYGVDPNAPLTYVGVAGAMLVIVAIATAVPALRVRKIDASRALRAE